MGPFHVAIVGIICGCLLALFFGRQKNGSVKLEQRVQEQQQQLDALLERIQTLEKIVTAEDFNLKQEINRL